MQNIQEDVPLNHQTRGQGGQCRGRPGSMGSGGRHPPRTHCHRCCAAAKRPLPPLPKSTPCSPTTEIVPLTEGDIKNLGVRNGSHRARIVSNLVMLRDKLQKKPGPPGATHSPTGAGHPVGIHSNPATPPSYVGNPDYSYPPGHSQRPLVGSDYIPIQIPFSQSQQTLGYIQMMPSPTDGPASTQEMYKYLWYHGNIPRVKAEKLVLKDGDFLVRDSISQPGDFVLTCNCKGAPLHFVINGEKLKDDVGKPAVQYHFEDMKFNRVPELIQHYIAQKKPISEMSRAVITNPVSRAIHSELADPKHSMIARAAGGSPKQSPFGSPTGTPSQSPPTHRRVILPQRSGSIASSGEISPAPGAKPASPLAQRRSGAHSPGLSRRELMIHREDGNQRHSSSSSPLSPDHGPPKPSRISSIRYLEKRPVIERRNQDLYEDDGKDYTDYDQVKAWPAALERERQRQGSGCIHTSNSSPSLSEAASNAPVLMRLKDAKPSEPPIAEAAYSQVQKGPKFNQPLPELPTEQMQRNDSISEDQDYDNNFDVASKIIAEADYDVPKSIRVSLAANGEVYDIPKKNGEVYDVPKKAQKLPNVQEAVDQVSEQSPTNESRTTGSSADDDFAELTPSKMTRKSMQAPDLNPESCFDLANFTCNILPVDNKPLENSTMAAVKTLILNSEAKSIAEHITKVDLEVVKVIGRNDLGAGVFSGLELLTLPQGHQLRLDIIERHNCLAKFVALTVLICAKQTERAQMLNGWVMIANELRSTLGNLFGFAAIMAGLKAPQVSRLRNTWISVKHNNPNTSFIFEAKLSTSIRAMDEGGSSLPLQNISIPHIYPLTELLERLDPNDNAPWEESRSDYGLDILLAHLDTARIITEQYGLYRVTGENALRDLDPIKDVLDAFRTEMHLKLLWGAKGAAVNRNERYTKFNQLLTILSERAEPQQQPIATPDGETSL